tara:strand:+ start:452 stop:1111 length:660 start_codon:yes stop_codon:yes gene_type:complete
MNTRTSYNWEFSSGVKNPLNLNFIDFDSDYPVLNCEDVFFSEVVACNDYKKINKKTLVSMFIDDYILERFWRNPLNYIKRFEEAPAVLSPDFSVLVGMPKPIIYWQTYKNRLIGKIWKDSGLNVIPSITWSDKSSFDIVFQGVQKKSVVAVSNIGCRNEKHLKYFELGYNEMIKKINPNKIIFMCNKKYKKHFQNDNVVFIPSFWDKKRKIWEAEADKV